MRSIPPQGSIPPGLRARSSGVGVGSVKSSEWNTGYRTWDGKVSSYKKSVEKSRNPLVVNSPIADKFPLKPISDIFDERNSYRIIMTLPYHQNLDDVRCEVVNDALFIESQVNGSNFFETFPLPKNVLPSSLKTIFKNGTLDALFKKEKEGGRKKKG